MSEYKDTMPDTQNRDIIRACKKGSLEEVQQLMESHPDNLGLGEILRSVCESGCSRGHVLKWLLDTFTFTYYQRQYALRGCCYNGDMEATQHAVALLKPTKGEIYVGPITPFEQACDHNQALAQWLAQQYPPTVSDIRNANDRVLMDIALSGELTKMQMVCNLVPLPPAVLYGPFERACYYRNRRMDPPNLQASRKGSEGCCLVVA